MDLNPDSKTSPRSPELPGNRAERFLSIRQVTSALAAPLSAEDCAIRSMPDASPVKWHLAHTTWFFETFVLAPHQPERRSMSAKTKLQSRVMSAKPALAGTKTKYTDEPLCEVQEIPDFLPSPAQLAFREEGVRVTLALSKKSIEVFKSEAAKHHTQYQRMIRRLLDAYVDGQAPTRQSTRTLRDKAAQRR